MMDGILVKIFDHQHYNVGDWRTQANCKNHDTNTFYLEQGSKLTNAIKKICIDCPVRQQCLEYAIKNHERHGIWGGMGHRSRLKYARKHHIN